MAVLGSRHLVGMFDSDRGAVLRGIKARAADVAKNLLSVSELAEAGMTVHFGKDSYLQAGRGGPKIPLQRHEGTYFLEMRALPARSAAAFHGQGGRP